MTRAAEGVELVVQRGIARGAPVTRIDGRPLDWWRGEARETLGLRDAPVVAAGHQTECWHAGILAKTLWAQALAVREGAQAVHLVVDQDAFDGMPIEWPWRRPDGWWGVRGHRFATGGAACGAQVVAFRPRAIECGEGVPASVAQALCQLQAGLERARTGAPDAAMQGAKALLNLAQRWVPEPAIVRATDLMRTALARQLLERMVRDPDACVEAFNAALALAPRAARLLRGRGAHAELPVWLLSSGGERRRGEAHEVADALARGEPVLPRAFLMSAIARTALAERFVHGLGGGVYERVTDAWMQTWVGWTPPPHDVASATVRMDLPMPSREREASMPFRRAWCDPPLLASGGRGPSPQRRRSLEAIAALPHGDTRRREAYRALVAERNEARLRMGGELETLRTAEIEAAAARISRELAARRTWCFMLLEPRRLDALRDALEREAG